MEEGGLWNPSQVISYPTLQSTLRNDFLPSLQHSLPDSVGPVWPSLERSRGAMPLTSVIVSLSVVRHFKISILFHPPRLCLKSECQ